MTANIIEEFARYLARKNSIAGELASRLDHLDGRNGDKTLRDLWELTDLSANDFADEVARFYGLRAAWPAAALRRYTAGCAVFAPLPARDLGLSLSGGRRRLPPRARRSDRRGRRPRRRDRARRAGRGRGRVVRGHRDRAGRAPRRRRGARRRRSSEAPSAPARRRRRKPARPGERRAGRARRQRPAGKGGRAARDRHPRRAVPHRTDRAHAGRRLAARRCRRRPTRCRRR